MTQHTRSQGTGVPFESVQEALVRARLDDLQADLRREIVPDVSARAMVGAGTGQTAKVPPAAGLRVRLGHRLVAIGAALAGEDERAHAHHPV